MSHDPRGRCAFPGLVLNEPCYVRILPIPSSADHTGPNLPTELFDRDLSAIVSGVGVPDATGESPASARLMDDWLEANRDPQLSRLNGSTPPSPFRYTVRPRHYLNGRTWADGLRVNHPCFILIRPEDTVSGSEHRAESPRFAPFPYPTALLAGIWRGRVKAIKDAPNGDRAGILRAVFDDPRIAQHADSRVSTLYGTEPWIGYEVTLTESPLTDSASARLHASH